ncbi:YcxB-like protein [Actinobacteria bacterium OK074]|nr:YcxB-like protein [Actinobacteria bacterium OK074]
MSDMGRDAASGGTHEAAALDTSEGDRPGAAVSLAYEITREDLAAAMRARLRVTKAGRPRRVIIILAGTLLVVNVVLGVTTGKWTLFPLIWSTVVIAMMLLIPRRQIRSFHRALDLRGTHHAQVTDAGVTVTSDRGSATLNWTGIPRYTETDEVFVLLSGDKRAINLTILPKRGLQDPADATRLREILDARTRRV